MPTPVQSTRSPRIASGRTTKGEGIRHRLTTATMRRAFAGGLGAKAGSVGSDSPAGVVVADEVAGLGDQVGGDRQHAVRVG
jgi:hypothetical protein